MAIITSIFLHSQIAQTIEGTSPTLQPSPEHQKAQPSPTIIGRYEGPMTLTVKLWNALHGLNHRSKRPFCNCLKLWIKIVIITT